MGENRTSKCSRQAITLFQGTTGFHLACEEGHTEIVNLLLARDDVDVDLPDKVSQHSGISLCLTIDIVGDNRTHKRLRQAITLFRV